MLPIEKPLKKVLDEYFLSSVIEQTIVDGCIVLFIQVKTYSNKIINTKLKLPNQWADKTYNEYNIIEVIKDLTCKLIEL